MTFKNERGDYPNFKIGTEVIVCGSGLNKFYNKRKVTKVYKNGNVVVDGVQYKQCGSKAGKYEYHQPTIKLFTPELWEELVGPTRFRRKRQELADLVMKMTSEQEVDRLLREIKLSTE